MKNRKKKKLKFAEIKETWGFYFFDKIIIAAIAASFIILFQSLAHKHQVILDTRMSLGKTYTDIMLKYRDNIIDTMSNYFTLIDEVKYNEDHKLNEAKHERDKVLQYSAKIRLYKNALCDINDFCTKSPKDTTCVDQKDTECAFKREADSFISEITDLTTKLLKGDYNKNDISTDSSKLQKRYLSFVDSHRKATMDIMQREMTEYGKYTLWEFTWSSISNYFKSKFQKQQN
jgi:hypothetical protein